MTIDPFNSYRSQFFTCISNLPASHQAKVSEYVFLAAKDASLSGNPQSYLTITKQRSAIAKKTTIIAIIIFLTSIIAHLVLLSLNTPYIHKTVLPILAITTLGILTILSIYRLIRVVNRVVNLYFRSKNLKKAYSRPFINFQKNTSYSHLSNQSLSVIKSAFKQARKTIRSQLQYHIASTIGISIVILSAILLIAILRCVLGDIGLTSSLNGLSLQQVLLMSAGTSFCLGILWNISLCIISMHRKNKSNHSAQQIVHAVQTMALA
ncbi:hypothetical protein CLAVI_000417 [Candidatus Clavichlamydia salmonicola]|uniref:hypothetical protein n=1 Tax=Candidatus Clavichlamydia salmonicola TaxID=469812 RepID=UPI001890C711|nr:hypothetical protein [Candidatus Clavichlamydia salmonicola]MBF5050798.1 hypothetical protein [Candidatus Clavichlamydia salmonicola]